MRPHPDQPPGGGFGGYVTVGNVNFNHLVNCSATACGAVLPAEGLFVLSDQPGTAVDTINTNKFLAYAGSASLPLRDIRVATAPHPMVRARAT
jgi:hypothetical protein